MSLIIHNAKDVKIEPTVYFSSFFHFTGCDVIDIDAGFLAGVDSDISFSVDNGCAL